MVIMQIVLGVCIATYSDRRRTYFIVRHMTNVLSQCSENIPYQVDALSRGLTNF